MNLTDEQHEQQPCDGAAREDLDSRAELGPVLDEVRGVFSGPPEPPQPSYPPWLGFFFNTSQPFARYVVKMGLLSLIPSLILGALVSPWTDQSAIEESITGGIRDPLVLLLMIVAIAPVLESLLLSLGIYLFSLLTRKPLPLALCSAGAWGVLHGMSEPMWGVVIMWPFFVFSMGYLAWRRKGYWYAVAAATGIHMFQNFFPGVIMVLTLG